MNTYQDIVHSTVEQGFNQSSIGHSLFHSCNSVFNFVLNSKQWGYFHTIIYSYINIQNIVSINGWYDLFEETNQIFRYRTCTLLATGEEYFILGE